MQTTRQLFSTDYKGGPCSSESDGLTAIQNVETAMISRIVVEHSTYVNALTVHYRDEAPGTRCGVNTGTISEVSLEPGEFISSIKGFALAAGILGQLTFIDNKGRTWGPYGRNTTATPFTWRAADLVTADLASQIGLLYFNIGWGTDCIGHLQATFASYSYFARPPTRKVVKYEKETLDLCLRVPTGFSKFSRTLMSPIVTLHIGTDEVVFRAYEDTLCRLPFFRAALKGEFLEASEKKIAMPEDNPQAVSALIEFLYDGSYTYTYKDTGTSVSDGETPVVELSEGLFHAQVYALAHKYDCQELVDAAKQSLAYMLRGLKGFDVVRLLKEVYGKGLALSKWQDDEDMKCFKKGLSVLLKKLFISNSEDMELILSECPVMGCDLLRLVLST